MIPYLIPKAICLLMLLFLFIELPAQQKLENGYIIKRNQDTLWGQVQDRKEGPFGYKYKKVRYSNGFLKRRRFGPSQISGYGIGQQHYESLWFDTQTKKLKTQFISIPRQGKQEFMHVVVKGSLSLYELEYTDLESNNILSIPLFKRRQDNYFIRVTQGVFGLKKKDLDDYFYDCPEVLNAIKNGLLEDPEAIATFYNSVCVKDNRP